MSSDSIRNILVVAAIVAAASLALWHKNAADAEKRAKEQATEQIAADIRQNFDLYISRARRLTDDQLYLLTREVHARIRADGFSPYQKELLKSDPYVQWEAFVALAAQVHAAVQETSRIRDDAMSRCTPVFGDKCEAMVDAWICLGRLDCSEGAIEGLEEIIQKTDYLEDHLSEYCRETIDPYDYCDDDRYADEDRY